jgi:hypothetical protein
MADKKHSTLMGVVVPIDQSPRLRRAAGQEALEQPAPLTTEQALLTAFLAVADRSTLEALQAALMTPAPEHARAGQWSALVAVRNALGRHQ